MALHAQGNDEFRSFRTTRRIKYKISQKSIEKRVSSESGVVTHRSSKYRAISRGIWWPMCVREKTASALLNALFERMRGGVGGAASGRGTVYPIDIELL